MEEFDSYYVIEVNGSKGWEVVWTSFDLEDAIAELNHELKQVPLYQVRLTTPVVKGGE